MERMIGPKAFEDLLRRAHIGIGKLIPKTWGDLPIHDVQIMQNPKGLPPNAYWPGRPFPSTSGFKPMIQAVIGAEGSGFRPRTDQMVDTMVERVGEPYRQSAETAADFEHGHELSTTSSAQLQRRRFRTRYGRRPRTSKCGTSTTLGGRTPIPLPS